MNGLPKRSATTSKTWLVLLFFVTALTSQPTAAQRDPMHAGHAFAQAYQLYSDQLYDQAMEAFATFQSEYPEHINAPEALYFQAESALSAGREQLAIQLFSRFGERYPKHPFAFRARLALGQHFYQAGSFDRAIEALESVVSDNPPPEIAAQAVYWMGAAAEQAGDTEAALRYYQRAADEYPTTEVAPVALYAVAYLFVRQDRLDEAARAFETLSERHPESSYARNAGLALAEIYYELEDYERVVAEVRRRRPQLDGAARERADFLLAEAYNQLRDSENAIVHYRPFTEGDPTNPYYRPAHYGLAWNYYREEVYQWAADHFAEAAEGAEDELAMRATYYEAVSRKIDRQHRRAIELFQEVTRRWPDGPLADHALYELGMTLYELRRWQEAHDAFDRLIEQYPQSKLFGEAVRQRGYTAVALGDFNAAFRDFDRAVELEAAPQSLKDEVAFQKAWLLYRTGDFAAAAPAFMALHERNPEAPKAGEALFWAAESFYQQNELDRAVRLFRQYRRDYDEGGLENAAHYALGWAYFKQGRYQEAVDAFTTFLNGYRESDGAVPYRSDALLRLADSYYALKRYADAVRTYERVLEDGGDYALFQIGQAHNHAGNASEAITTFQKLLQQYPESTYREEAQYGIGYLHFQQQAYDQAVEAYRTLLRTHPNDPLAAKAQYAIGDALYNQGRLEEAVEAYSEVLERYPNSPFVADAATSIQYALIAIGDEARADALIEAFIREHPNSPIIPELRFRQAEVRYQSGLKDRALADFEAFIRTHGENAQAAGAYYYLGLIYTEQNRMDEAERALRRVVASFPRSEWRVDAARRLGQLYLNQERHLDALAVYRQMESMRPQDAQLVAESRYGQSQALMSLNRLQEAETLLQEAVEAAPSAPESALALLGLARIREQEGDVDEAVRLYRQVVEQSREDAGAEALFRLGVLLLEQGDSRSAIGELSRLPALYPGHIEWVAQGYLAQARAFRSLGQNGDASRLYDRVIEEFPGTPYARQASQEKASL